MSREVVDEANVILMLHNGTDALAALARDTSEV